ncbi:hypothetical protein OC842_006821 [Tilletia horrida]|uniref:UDENN domain-containing protein n=1 Tax=Tilletia horrida TaxID=155126 RepID=A0AAN6G4T7_9BASI|nr:hypothetical protein OC842_006821 [Tilletia horrida]
MDTCDSHHGTTPTLSPTSAMSAAQDEAAAAAAAAATQTVASMEATTIAGSVDDAPKAVPASGTASKPADELTLTSISLDEEEEGTGAGAAAGGGPSPASAATASPPAPVVLDQRPGSVSLDQSRASIQTTASATNTNGTHTPYEVFGDHSSAGAQTTSEPVILGIAVVDFNHLVGPQIEFAHPNSLLDDQDLSSNLPFLALPDGSHLSDEDFCYFHLHAPNLSPSTIFGISCNRQIASDALLRKGAEVTRSTVQKAVVVLAREPVFGPIREKLGIVTRAFFAQGDLADINILIDFHATLEAGLQSGGFSTDREAALYMGTSLRELIHKWRFKTLVLVKLLLLQRNIMFYGYPIEQLCTQQYSLVSLIPGLLASLQDAGLPNLDTRTATRAKAESLRTSDRKSLLRFLGMPLNLFGADAFFQPYLPLQQIDLLKGSTYLVGTSNSIYRQQKDCDIDVIVDLEHSTLEFVNPTAQRLSALTPADRKWISELEQLVLTTWNPADPSRPAGMQYEGSDDHLRARFEEYICAMLASVKYSQFDKTAGRTDTALAGTAGSSTQAFGLEFLDAFMRTKAFPSWNLSTDPMIFDIIDHRHPCDGKTSAIEDVGLRLAAGLQDMHLEENLAPARQAIGSAISVGGAGLYRFASGLKSEVNKLREARAAAGGGGDGAATASSSSSAAASLSGSKELPTSASQTQAHPLSPASLISGFRIPGTSSASAVAPPASPGATGTGAAYVSPTSAPAQGAGAAGSAASGVTAKELADVAAQTADRAAQAAAQAGTQVRAALGSFGSFLAKQQRQWAATSSSTTTTTTAAAGGESAAAAAGTGASSSSSRSSSGGLMGAGGWASLVGGMGGASTSTAASAEGVARNRDSRTLPPVPPTTKEVPNLPSELADAMGSTAANAGDPHTVAEAPDSAPPSKSVTSSVETSAQSEEAASVEASGAGLKRTSAGSSSGISYPPQPASSSS